MKWDKITTVLLTDDYMDRNGFEILSQDFYQEVEVA